MKYSLPTADNHLNLVCHKHFLWTHDWRREYHRHYFRGTGAIRQIVEAFVDWCREWQW